MPNNKSNPKSKLNSNSKSVPKSISKLNTKTKTKTKSIGSDFYSSISLIFKSLQKEKYLKDPTIQMYFKLLLIDINKLSDNKSDDFYSESKNMVLIFCKYPIIMKEICRYVLYSISKVTFLQNFSSEQNKYVTSLELFDSKLVACAGSGKTRSIIGRIKFMVDHHLAKKEEIFAITFSRHAALDFHQKIKKLFPDYEDFCILKNFSTIDSLAKAILCMVKSHKSNNVEILSIAFRNYLKNMTPDDVEIIRKRKNICHLFIDEAQDLNEIQYDAIMLLKQKFNTQVHLIGDPNQNIFQFRRSSSTYLINFPAKCFELTLNFRSTKQIIDFSESIKPIKTSTSISATNRCGDPVIIMTNKSSEIHKFIINFIQSYSKKKDISNIAIICPTRGIKLYNTVGLSVFFNLLKINKIPFNQLYDESGLNDERKKDVGKIDGHINLLTYHGTKGLEFDVVFVMDMYHYLYNINPSVNDHKINQYLLYVALSRAISHMYICTYSDTHGGNINHWISFIPPSQYFTDKPLQIAKLGFRNETEKQTINGITELINGMTDENLNMIHDILHVDDMGYTKRIFKDFTHIDREKNESLFGLLIEELFYLQYCLAGKLNPRDLHLIQLIIDNKFVVLDNDTDCKKIKQYIVLNNLTWSYYDQQRNTIPNTICDIIDNNFSRDNELYEYVILTNEFIKIIKNNLDDIKNTYHRYLNPQLYNWEYKSVLIDLFYLIVVQYSYDNNHYYYICDHGKEKQFLLKNGKELFAEMNNYAMLKYLMIDINTKVRVSYPKLRLIGEIDFIEKYKNANIEHIVEIKCVKEIGIRHYLQLILYNFCYYNKMGCKDKIFTNSFKIINFLTGLEHYITIAVSSVDMFDLLNMLADIGNLHFNDLNLVYDLETTNKILPISSEECLKEPPNIPRSKTYKKNDIYIGKIYPEITEITIKDYDTGMTILDTLVKPYGDINPEAQKITGIKLEHLINKPTIDTIRKIMNTKMKNIEKCKMIAHGGCRFDNEIIQYDKLIDPNKILFLDSLSIIPIHLPASIDLVNKKLSNIYFQIFGKKFKAHRAKADVNALIKIMQYLKIQF